MSSHQFGGRWTEEKLERLRKYLVAYTTIFKSNERASYLRTAFVDAFAGTGTFTMTRDTNDALLTDSTDVYDEEAQSFQKGSAQIAIEVEPSFDQYLFVEKKAAHIHELEKLRSQFPNKADQIKIVQGDANVVLKEWCQQTDWHTNRAVVFLDPYGMAVEWRTIEAIAHTQAADLWILFPLGQAVNRLLTRSGPPSGAWAERLTQFFGTEEWKAAFYRPRQQLSLFDTEEALEKGVNLGGIGQYFVDRLSTIFAQVAENPLPLRNSRNVPIYLLCFAAANPKGAPTAVKIAQHILRR
jgi:three-Cys-motif partner protein